MDQPLGRAVGNAVEVAECVECLRGEGPPDLMDLSIELAAEMVVMAGHSPERFDEARVLCRQAVADGSALERFRGVVIAQGGDPAVHRRPDALARTRDRRVRSALALAESCRDWPPGRSGTRRCCWGPAAPASIRQSTRPSASSCTRRWATRSPRASPSARSWSMTNRAWVMPQS